MDNEEKKISDMDDQERKHAAPRQILHQVHTDFTIAMALQDQQRDNNPHILPSIESEDEEEEDDDEGYEDVTSDEDDNNYYEGFEFEGEIELYDSSSDDEYMEEEEIDTDELSYEELIGEEKRGLCMNDISKCLLPCKYRYLESKNGIDKCVICQVDYGEGELLASLHCHHPYHSDCISKWLHVRNICPICSSQVSSPNIATTP